MSALVFRKSSCGPFCGRIGSSGSSVSAVLGDVDDDAALVSGGGGFDLGDRRPAVDAVDEGFDRIPVGRTLVDLLALVVGGPDAVGELEQLLDERRHAGRYVERVFGHFSSSPLPPVAALPARLLSPRERSAKRGEGALHPRRNAARTPPGGRRDTPG